MAKKNDTESTEKIREKATLLLLLLQETRLSDKECWQLILWLLRSHRHLGEFILIYRQDRELTRAMNVERESPKVTHLNRWRGSPQRLATPMNWRGSPHGHAKPRRRYRIVGRAAAALFVAAAILLVAPKASSPVRMSVVSADGMIATANRSETRRLQDGTTVAVDPKSTLREEFSAEKRAVHLFQGKTIFDVAQDTQKRPFVVKTPYIDITVTLNAKFAVKVDITTEIEVLAGAVELSKPGAKPGTPTMRLEKGEAYVVPVEERGVVMAAKSDALKTTLIGG